MDFARLRGLLNSGWNHFQTIYTEIGRMEGSEKAVAIDYADRHLENKDPETRELPKEDVFDPPQHACLARKLNCNIRDLDVDQSTGKMKSGDLSFITHLKVERNSEYFPFEKTPYLENLVLNDAGLDLSWLPTLASLRELNVSRTHLRRLSKIKEQPSLQQFLVNSCDLLSLDGIGNFPELTHLYARENKKLISVKDLSRCEKIEYVDFGYCGLTGLLMDSRPQLERAYLDGNEIESLWFIKPHPELKFLSVRQNPLTSLSGLESQPSLEAVAVDKELYDALPDKESYAQILKVW